MAKILIVDDDPHIRKLIRVILSDEGFTILEAEDGKDALSLLDSEKVDLIILDIMMPNMDGWDLCENIRTYYSDSLPILMLTAKGETAQKVKGFNLGADDYLVKPFHPAELLARIKALLKRYQIIISNKVNIGNFELDRSTYQVFDGRNEITLPLKEFELLYKLVAHPGKTFSREQLIEDIWGYNYEGDERTVDVHIKRLRQRFSDENYPFKITTIRGLGYRLEVKK
ncbi:MULTISPECIES: response regulator transcription factor [Aeribacillus]|uniref:response regulator transcription factor n=1 Tax=Aeribacillus TaxID=1055323 RepID=UPI0007B4AE83|nr:MULTISPECIES: response regulator transcription factor [Aeribacillus]REJ22676.1 MAG: DNA-binding response regulator [Bacillaceae bacterium]KZM52821.1 DNA-binding response regulator [Aeribacillus pallidus]MED0650714.1 response regulator transcription factor [Aeribacillus composti]MED0701265.1 response regulator transcription factor [Aeribacillus composti]MED4486774.1 response regulator transcription factor [Aeribacillus pallidus]